MPLIYTSTKLRERYTLNDAVLQRSLFTISIVAYNELYFVLLRKCTK